MDYFWERMIAQENILVVLGYPADENGKPGAILKARLDKAIELYKMGVAKTMILTGAAVENEFVEAEVMAAYCIKHGVPPSNILMESNARNTYENARMVRDIMKEMNYDNAIVVTSSFHKMRAEKFFSRVVGNARIIAAPFPQEFSFIMRTVFMVKEYLIIMLYNLGLLNNRYSIQ
jgi:uncharacterized SAM-binding protein YcdF (DUF218 family)